MDGARDCADRTVWLSDVPGVGAADEEQGDEAGQEDGATRCGRRMANLRFRSPV